MNRSGITVSADKRRISPEKATVKRRYLGQIHFVMPDLPNIYLGDNQKENYNPDDLLNNTTVS